TSRRCDPVSVPNSSSSSEHIESLMDRNPATKWYAGSGNQPTSASPIYAIYTLSTPAEVTAYSLTSGNDAPERDPKDWTVLGSNSETAATNAADASWTVVDARASQSFSARGQRSVFPAASPASYRYYQLRVTANLANSSTSANNLKFQLADWTLRAGSAGHTASLLTASATWSYLEDGTVDPADGAADRTAWTQVGATLPGTWKAATGPFGAKGGSATPNIGANFPVATVLKYYLNGTTTPTVPAYFFRTTFELDQAGLDSIGSLYGTVVHDDAATVYINGTAVADYPGTNVPTANLGYGGNNLTDPAADSFVVSPKPLRVGENVVSVELHNVNSTSSDVYFALPGLAAASESIPEPFTPAETGATYPSGTVASDFFTKLLSGFNDVKDAPAIVAPNSSGPANDGSAVLAAANDRVERTVNNGGAGSEQAKVDKRAQAVYDADNSSYIAMTDALGSVLGPIYRTALQTGQLPKTKWLLDNVENSSYEAANNAAKAAYGYQRPMNRLGFTTGGTCSGGAFTGTTGWIIPNYGSTSGYNGLCTQGSFPSGHTLHGYTAGTTMATILPEFAPQFLYRASEYGNNRMLLGFHYPMDVMAGRIIGQASVANRWSDAGFRALLTQATAELRTVLGAECVELGHSSDLVECAAEGSKLASDADALKGYTDRLSYAEYTTTDGTLHTDGFPVAFDGYEHTALTVPDGAADLLRTSFPDLTDAQRALVIRATALPGGYALDKTKDGQASWQRVNLLAAMEATVTTDRWGNLIVNGENAGGGTTPSSDATLATLTVDGTAVAGFAPSTTAYAVELPAGTTAVPVVGATSADPNATVEVTQAAALPGTAVVEVTAQDGTTLQTYRVGFTVAPEPEPEPVLASLKASTATTTYNQPARVAVVVTAPGVVPGGTVRVTEGSTLLGSGALVGGKATVTLPKTLAAGRHSLAVSYLPNSSTVVAPAPAKLTLTVNKANASLVKVTITKGKKGTNRVAKNKKATLKIQLAGVGSAAPSGTVTIKVGSKSFGSAKVTRSGSSYVAVVKTKSLKSKGTIKVVYSGSANPNPRTFTTKVKVK
ncbi:MAG: phosphatase PAP2 family protein, partial [Propionicimonas sp.]